MEIYKPPILISSLSLISKGPLVLMLWNSHQTNIKLLELMHQWIFGKH